MGKLVNICAGADLKTLPVSRVEAILINAPNFSGNDKKINAAREMCLAARPEYLMLDSGGFQVLEGELKSKKMTFNPDIPMKCTGKEINLTPKHVMSAGAIHKPAIVVGLDFPVRKLKASEQHERQVEFMKKLNFNAQWTIESAFWHRQLCPQTKFFLPIQCYNLEQLETFLDNIGNITFDGVSMPIRNLKVWEIVLFLVRFHQIGVKRVHLLGTSSFFVIALCAYMAKHMFDWVSLDASSWRIAAQHSEYFNPYDLSREKLGENVVINSEIENDCPCPHCTGKSFLDIQNLPYKKRLILLRNHNWWTLEGAFRSLYQNSSDVVQLERFMKHRSKYPAKVDALCNTLSLACSLKDTDINSLQNLFASIFNKKKQSRMQTIDA